MMMGRWFGGWGYGTVDGGGWWTMGIGMIFTVLFWGALIYLAVRYFRCGSLGGGCGGHGTHSSHFNTDPGPQESAEEILRRRYAQGEITQEQYRQMQETLRK
ncbi:MAG: SHOCT domain-containing protein [Clostridia bacterium]|nr:SHOCT domain-containing protein [Clostridia bacterium]